MSPETEGSLLGKQLGPCELVDLVGSGTFGSVFRARDNEADAWRAVKVMLGPIAALTAFRFRLPNEMRTAAELSHPHIVPVYWFGVDEELQYIVMEFVESGTLDDYLRQVPVDRRLADPTIHQCIRDVASALDYAHAQGAVHADLRPSNVLLRATDRRALVTDFCIARAIPVPRIAEAGLSIDCAYLPPEQCRGGAMDVKPSSDVYALAATLWHVVTGAPPFGTGMEARARHLEEPVPQLRQVASHLPAALEAVFTKGLAKSPSDRFQRASQLATAFVEAATRKPRAQFTAPPVRRPPATPQWRPPPPAPRAAPRAAVAATP